MKVLFHYLIPNSLNTSRYFWHLFSGSKKIQGTFQVALVVKNLPDSAGATGDTSSNPGLEDSLEYEMATHCSFLVWRIPWTEEPGGLQSMGLQRVRHNRAYTQSWK